MVEEKTQTAEFGGKVYLNKRLISANLRSLTKMMSPAWQSLRLDSYFTTERLNAKSRREIFARRDKPNANFCIAIQSSFSSGESFHQCSAVSNQSTVNRRAEEAEKKAANYELYVVLSLSFAKNWNDRQSIYTKLTLLSTTKTKPHGDHVISNKIALHATAIPCGQGISWSISDTAYPAR